MPVLLKACQRELPAFTLGGQIKVPLGAIPDSIDPYNEAT